MMGDAKQGTAQVQQMQEHLDSGGTVTYVFSDDTVIEFKSSNAAEVVTLLDALQPVEDLDESNADSVLEQALMVLEALRLMGLDESVQSFLDRAVAL